MLQIQQFGALPPGMTAKDDEPLQLAPPARFADGPQMVVGPFSFPANQPGPFTVHVPFAKMQAREDVKVFGSWAVNQIRHLSERNYAFCTVSYDGVRWGNPPMGPCVRTFFPQYMARSRGRSYNGIEVPDGEVWDIRFITGKAPIAKFKHPVTGKDWAAYLTIEEGVLVFTFKEREPGFWASLWNALKSIVATLVEFVSGLIDIIKSAFCSMAQSYLGDLEKLANRDPEALKPENLTATNAKFAKLGISSKTLDEVWKGSMTGMAVQSLANAVGERICGTGAPKVIYPGGSIKTRVGANWRIAIPVGTKISTQLGQTHQEVQPTSTDVPAIEVDTGAFEAAVAKPWYKKWWVWVGIGVAAAGATTATVMIVRD